MKVVTHNGIFHADEVFAIATLEIFMKQQAEVIRTRDNAIIAESQNNSDIFVLDLGLKFEPDSRNFDHHQDGSMQATNLLILNYLRVEGLVEEQLAQELYPLFEGISNFDTNAQNILQAWDGFNSQAQYRMLSQVISGFNRNPFSAEQDIQFRKAVDFACEVLKNEIHLANERIKAQAIWEEREELNNGRVLVFGQFCPIWKEKAKDSSVEFAVLPTSPTQWSILSIDSAKFPLPIEQDLKAMMSDSTQLVFAHAGRFTAGFKNSKAAIEVAEKL